MDAFDGELSDVEESQATQMLLDLAPPSPFGVRSPLPAARPVKPNVILPSDLSSDSYSSSRSTNPLPTYHFHGLASTQTQNTPTEEQAQEGSQKENIQAPVAVADARQTPGTSRAVQNESPSKRPAHKTPKVDKEGHSVAHSKTRTPNTRPIAKSARRSTSAKPPNKTTKQNKPNTASGVASSSRSRQTRGAAPPSPISSQDSFALDPPRDLEEQFLAINRNFNVPLAELGAPAEGSNRSGTSRSLMYSLPRHGGPLVAEPQGKVLVESTPTNSTSSQSQSQSQGGLYGAQPYVEVATQIIGPYLPPNTSNRDGDDSDSAPESSFGRSLYEPSPASSPQPTQPVFQQATQVATQPVDGDVQMTDTTNPFTTTGPSVPQSHATDGQTAPQTNPAGPSSLIGMVAPHNRYRYAQYQQQQQQQQQPQQPPSAQATTSAPSTDQPTQLAGSPATPQWDETQPTAEEEAAPPPRRFPPPRTTSRSKAQPSVNPFYDGHDGMEIVPDSEAQHSSPQRPQYQPQDASDIEEEEKDNDEEGPEEQQSRPIRSKKPDPRLNNSATPSDSEEGGEDSDDDYDQRPAKKRVIEKDDDSEDDTPLAINKARKATAKPVDKGKGKLKETDEQVPKPTNPARNTRQKVIIASPVKTRATQKKAQSGAATKGRGKRPWETDVIPSSVPEEEVAPSNSKQKGKGKGKKPPSKASAAAPVKSTAGSKRRRSLDTASVEEDVDDQATEPADEEEEEGSEEVPKQEPVAGPSMGNKRKRGGKAAAAKVVVKRERKRQGSPPGKLLRSTMASAKRNSNATRVFALWKPDSHYYAGTIKCAQDSLTYSVLFDDENEAPITIDQMRILDLRVGDEVLSNRGNIPGEVVGVDKLLKGFVTVRCRNQDKEFELRNIRIPARTIVGAWGDRVLSKDLIVPLLQPKPLNHEPSPSHRSLKDSPSWGENDHGDNFLSSTAMIVTLSTTNSNWSKDKEAVRAAVNEVGASIIDDMVGLFSLTGEWQDSGNRWVIKTGDIAFKTKHYVGRLFLLADAMNQKPKYLMALALGIPCLSTDWLHQCVKEREDKPWMPFLLEQGHSEYLNAPLTQQVDAHWGSSQFHLSSIMSNTVPMRLLRGASILCVGPDIMPQPKGKKHVSNSQNSQDAINTLPRVMACMGAERVEAVLAPGHASSPFDHYTYIVTRNSIDNDKWPELPRGKLVDWPWIKGSLIANRLLPIPEHVVQENSQEA